jgi:flagellar hook-associated protein 1
MGTSTLMGLGTRAMFANFAALHTIGNNIANANTEGYSRQQANLATAGGQFTGAGFFGRGVDVATVTRSYDKFLTTQATNSASLAAQDASHLDHRLRGGRAHQLFCGHGQQPARRLGPASGAHPRARAGRTL